MSEQIGHLKILSYERVFKVLTGLCALTALTIIFSILLITFINGIEQLSFDFILGTETSTTGQGGIGYQIIGTLILVTTAILIVTPCSAAMAILHFSVKRKRWIRLFNASLQVLNASPSILFGILGFTFFIKICGWEKSWLAGGVVLALMILPTVTVSLIGRINTIPKGYIETARSLGLTHNQLLKSVIFPYGYGGLLTGLVMGISRAAGETAPIMFVAVVFSGATLPDSFTDSPVLALPYHIFNLAQDVFGDQAIQSAWASAFVLISFVLLCSIAIAPFRSRSHEEAK